MCCSNAVTALGSSPRPDSGRKIHLDVIQCRFRFMKFWPALNVFLLESNCSFTHGWFLSIGNAPLTSGMLCARYWTGSSQYRGLSAILSIEFERSAPCLDISKKNSTLLSVPQQAYPRLVLTHRILPSRNLQFSLSFNLLAGILCSHGAGRSFYISLLTAVCE